MFHKLTAFLKAQYAQFGFQEVISPTIYKKSLWEKSGHWENYAADMFSVTGRGFTGEGEGKQIGENEEFGLKPMNCPGHCLLFASKARSFRDLPIRFSDFSPLHRNEISGALSGLTRVRRFHQDDGHIFCRPSQVAEEISRTLNFVRLAYETFNLGPYRLALSTRPEDHYIGALEEWDSAENALRGALEKSGQEWSLNPGDGAFYGPKIDIILKDSDGKEHQTATIQLDFQLPKRFELEYIAPAPELEAKGQTTDDPKLLAVSGPVRPVMVHRAVLGSVERFMALLIEHYNGRWPFWLNPKQVSVITVSDDPATVEFAKKAMDIMQTAQLMGFDTVVKGVTNDYSQTAGSDVVIITSGIPRKPGMTREELIGVNAGIVKSVAENCLKYSPDAILVIVANPMDPMAYLTYKTLGLPRNRVIGMGGALDSSRFKYFISQAIGCNANEVEGIVIGGHGDTTMIPLPRLATYKGMPICNFLSEEKVEEVVKSTMVGGATLTGLLGTSAWMAPGAAASAVAESIIKNQGKMITCAAYLDGEYGMKDIMIGVPVVLGKNGIERIVEIELTEDEKAKFAASEAAVRKTNSVLYETGILK